MKFNHFDPASCEFSGHGPRAFNLSESLESDALCLSQSRRLTQSPHQDRQEEDAEEGKKLLAQDGMALYKEAWAGSGTKVGRILAPCLSIPATFDLTRANARTLIPTCLLPSPRSQITGLAAWQVGQLIACGADVNIKNVVLPMGPGPYGERNHFGGRVVSCFVWIE